MSITQIDKHPDAGWDDNPTFYVETRSPITEKLQLAHPSHNTKRFRYGIGGIREIWDRKEWRNKWVWPLSRPEEITPDDDETFIVLGGSDISREECKEMVGYMRQKAAKRRGDRQVKRPSERQINDALNVLAEKRIAAAKGNMSFVVPKHARLLTPRGAEAQAMASVAKTGAGF